MATSAIPSRPRAAYSVRETCQQLGVSKDWLYRQLREEKIRSVKISGRRFIPATELDRIAHGAA